MKNHILSNSRLFSPILGWILSQPGLNLDKFWKKPEKKLEKRIGDAHLHGIMRHGKDGAFQPFGWKMALQDQPPVAAAAGKGSHGKWKGNSGTEVHCEETKHINICEVHFPICKCTPMSKFRFGHEKSVDSHSIAGIKYETTQPCWGLGIQQTIQHRLEVSPFDPLVRRFEV